LTGKFREACFCAQAHKIVNICSESDVRFSIIFQKGPQGTPRRPKGHQRHPQRTPKAPPKGAVGGWGGVGVGDLGYGGGGDTILEFSKIMPFFYLQIKVLQAK